ncbi:response regulator transcription factor [Paenibacillus glucanolyticus]|uniref:response regulator transcription factor n=1 Tax=Paenibacillus glucanolyticus TaxID=59843 RepID=UPI00128CF15C|nr:response regulator [Paenibacillus glucanolyticus]MPY18843.1 response regulator [Paenibacillus glucanolyticus]
MYNVMLVDDDYPVIELLSETISWNELGLNLMGSYENGMSAWEHARTQPPDILITDIGMPKMNGLELSARIKEVKADVRIAILSCHNEFQYAQQAMRLNVQDYLLKDTLDPEELAQLLRRFKQAMDEEVQKGWERSRMIHLVDESRELRKEQSFKNFIHQPLLSPEKWQHELSEYGVLRPGHHCLPVIGYLEDARDIKHRFASNQTLHFALSNVLREVLDDLNPDAVHVGYDAKTSLLLFSYAPGLKNNIYDEVAACLQGVRATLTSVLRIRMSFLVGSGCASPEGLKLGLNELLACEHQRFYLEPGEVSRSLGSREKPGLGRASDPFVHYEQASSELRESLLSKDAFDAVRDTADRWIAWIQENRFAPELVKDWVLKLLLDMKLRLHLLQSLSPAYTADALHKEIMDMDSLNELRSWLYAHLESTAQALGGGFGGSRRSEVADACKYVSLRLDRRITLDEVAGSLHLNPSYFSRLFKKETGITFIEYVTRMKMERAKDQLRQTDRTVGEICESLAYDYVSYFSKIFKAYAGVTPIEYRSG